jgi:hypothetical protein
MLTGHLYAEVERHEVAGSSEGRWWCSQARVARRKGKKLIGGACVSVIGEREGKSVKGATRQRKSIPKNAPKALGHVGSGERWWPVGRGWLT